ncbi:MAG: pyridoxal phosphate-dependent aminotransferase, partial [Anaerolineae bacterium]|nr:pyridoxal phosphate-dependent aminotransferase [Anaerolineae bacterium]
MSDRLTNYLAWAREKSAVLHDGAGLANLFASAVQEPRALLLEDLHALGLDGVLSRMETPMAWGHPELVAGLRARYSIPAGRDILITSSGSMAFVVAALAFTRPGDHALVESPVYQPFINVLRERGVQTTALPRPAPDFQPDLDRLAAALTPQTRLVVLTNLHNPSGALLADETLREIAGLAARQGGVVVV